MLWRRSNIQSTDMACTLHRTLDSFGKLNNPFGPCLQCIWCSVTCSRLSSYFCMYPVRAGCNASSDFLCRNCSWCFCSMPLVLGMNSEATPSLLYMYLVLCSFFVSLLHYCRALSLRSEAGCNNTHTDLWYLQVIRLPLSNRNPPRKYSREMSACYLPFCGYQQYELSTVLPNTIMYICTNITICSHWAFVLFLNCKNILNCILFHGTLFLFVIWDLRYCPFFSFLRIYSRHPIC